jgi:ubiquinone/menaquinone biosynthesis C-methylase UbiE
MTDGITGWQWALIIIFLMIAVNYIIYVLYDVIYGNGPRETSIKEGYVDGSDATKEPSQSEQSRYEWLSGLDVYDDFFANIYDKLVQGEKRSQAEVVALSKRWRQLTPSMPLAEWNVLDLGCGTGVTAVAFARAGVGSITGVDRSEPMLRRARDVTVASSTLTPNQRAILSWKHADIENPNAFRAAQFTHASAMYFTMYYVRDKSVFFGNIYNWMRPGGVLSVFACNKHKFDPMLESAAPFAFSLQKYADKRITKSRVKFDKFDYEGEFDITDGAEAYFRETFYFKDGTVRRQRHDFWMPEFRDIVKTAEAIGWKYVGFEDCAPIGMEYCYIMTFIKPQA